jgi:hypothetical protein
MRLVFSPAPRQIKAEKSSDELIKKAIKMFKHNKGSMKQ